MLFAAEPVVWSATTSSPFKTAARRMIPRTAKTRCRTCHVAEHNPIDPQRAAWRELVNELLDA